NNTIELLTGVTNDEDVKFGDFSKVGNENSVYGEVVDEIRFSVCTWTIGDNIVFVACNTSGSDDDIIDIE
ncbi:13510_t:CDS:1, partial [Ambispora leptoticha]